MAPPTVDIRFGDDLREQIRANLARFEPLTHHPSQGKQAAVALTIVDVRHHPHLYNVPFSAEQATDAAILLTQRAAKMNKHAGQWALPGGRMDAGETPEETALRELEEEVGVRLSAENILGRLDDFTTRSGFTMKCIVMWGGSDLEFTLNPAEVASAHRIPLAEFMRSDAPILKEVSGSQHPILLMPVGDSWIAAPTGALLYQFREVGILGKSTRVAHFEQPRFTWK